MTTTSNVTQLSALQPGTRDDCLQLCCMTGYRSGKSELMLAHTAEAQMCITALLASRDQTL